MQMTMSKLNTLIANAVAAHMAGTSKPKANKPAKTAKPSKTDFMAGLIEACAKRGFADPKPNENILTYNKWLANGRRVRKGEKAITVNGKKTMLFHVSQTDVEAAKAA